MLETPQYLVDTNSGGPKLEGMFADLKTKSILGAGLHASLRVSESPTAKVTMSPDDQLLADEFWVDDIGASRQ